MIRLDTNSLCNYLLLMAKRLERTSAAQLAANLHSAAQQGVALGAGLPTDFLGDSLTALRKVLNEEKGALRGSERDDLLSVIEQIDIVLKRNPPTGSEIEQ
jgi:hypothetical protein